MVLIQMFNVAVQVVAAYVIFLGGYFALLVSLTICFVMAKGLYEGMRWVWAYALKSA
jgi:hypothetical protein